MKKIFILTLVVIVMMLTLSTEIKASQPVPSVNYSSLDDVTIINNGVKDLKWLLFDDGFWYLDYDGNGLLSNGLFNLNYIIEFQSTGRYKIMQFYNGYTGQYITFDFNFSNYYEFDIEYNVLGDYFTITINDENTQGLIGYVYTIRDAYIRMYDSEWVVSNQDYIIQQNINKSYQDGFVAGQESKIEEAQELIQDNYDDIYQDAYEQTRTLFGYYDNDLSQWLSATAYGSLRYTQGQADASDNVIALKGFIPAILGTVFAFFFQIASIGVLGISILDIIGALFGIVILLFVIKMLLGK